MREVNTKEINWYPLQKVNFARRKLEGANPSAITRYSQAAQPRGHRAHPEVFRLQVLKRSPRLILRSEELKLGFEKDEAFSGMQAVALGAKEHNVRAQLPAEGLTVEKQVDCLLDQATDPNVLGRAWVGWEPWM